MISENITTDSRGGKIQRYKRIKPVDGIHSTVFADHKETCVYQDHKIGYFAAHDNNTDDIKYSW